MTFSFRRNLDIRHRLPDRMGQGVVKIGWRHSTRVRFLRPGAARTALGTTYKIAGCDKRVKLRAGRAQAFEFAAIILVTTDSRPPSDR
jgi:hypothetical protein